MKIKFLHLLATEMTETTKVTVYEHANDIFCIKYHTVPLTCHFLFSAGYNKSTGG